MENLLQRYIDMAKLMSRTTANIYEYIVFDTSDDQLPVAAHFNKSPGTVEPIRQLVKDVLANDNAVRNGAVHNRVVTTEKYKMQKVSLLLIKDDNGQVAGVYCISVSLTPLMKLSSMLNDMLSINVNELGEEETIKASDTKDYGETSLAVIDKVIQEANLEPGRITVDERLDILCDLYDLGVFDIKGAVAKVSDALKISQQTIYRNVSEIRKARS